MDITIKDLRVRETYFSRIKKIATPFSIHFWLLIFLLTLIILVNVYITSNIIINILLVIISIVILFF
jgi:hypothetical protein